MPTPSERRALLFIAAVAALGLGVRGLRVVAAGQGPATPAAALAAQIAVVDSAVATGGRPRRAKAKAADAAAPASREGPAHDREPLDMDQADIEALDQLPGIGPALARRIVEDRDANGPFGSVDGLQRVRGIGPALAARLAPLVTFSGVPRQAPRP